MNNNNNNNKNIDENNLINTIDQSAFENTFLNKMHDMRYVYEEKHNVAISIDLKTFDDHKFPNKIKKEFMDILIDGSISLSKKILKLKKFPCIFLFRKFFFRLTNTTEGDGLCGYRLTYQIERKEKIVGDKEISKKDWKSYDFYLNNASEREKFLNYIQNKILVINDQSLLDDLNTLVIYLSAENRKKLPEMPKWFRDDWIKLMLVDTKINYVIFDSMKAKFGALLAYSDRYTFLKATNSFEWTMASYTSFDDYSCVTSGLTYYQSLQMLNSTNNIYNSGIHFSMFEPLNNESKKKLLNFSFASILAEHFENIGINVDVKDILNEINKEEKDADDENKNDEMKIQRMGMKKKRMKINKK
jgi:hypothetical protein